MGRFQHLATRLSIVGALALVVGSSLVAGVITQALTSSAFADTAPYETSVADTPAGNIVLNDVVVTGALSPASPTTGSAVRRDRPADQRAQLPLSVVQQIRGHRPHVARRHQLRPRSTPPARRPSSIPTGAVAFDMPIPNPGPVDGGDPGRPLADACDGRTVHAPRAATSPCRSVPRPTSPIIDGAGIGTIDLALLVEYPNDPLPSGFTGNNVFPPGLPIVAGDRHRRQVTPAADTPP